MKNNRTILAIFVSLLLIVAVGVYSISFTDNKPIKTTSNIDYSNGAKKTYVQQQCNYGNQTQTLTSPISSTATKSQVKVDANRVAYSPLTGAKASGYTVLNTPSSTNNQGRIISLSSTSNKSYTSTSSASTASSSFSTTSSVGTISLSESFSKMTTANETLTRADWGNFNNDPGEVVPIGSVLPLLLLGALYVIRKMFFC